MAIRTDLEFVHEDDTQLTLLVLQSDGVTPYDLTGKRVELLVKPSRYSDDADAIFQISSVSGAPARITITNAVGGAGVADLTNLLDTEGAFWFETWVADVTDPLLDVESWAYGVWLVGTDPSSNVRGACSSWAEASDTCEPCSSADFDAGVLADAQVIASDVLFEFTNRRWPGECFDTVRPCGYRQPDSCGCRSSQTCGCRRLSKIELPGRPVVEVTSVTIDGIELDPARYRLDDHRWLVYLPESDDAERQGWPCCQRIDLPDTEEDTWSVEYVYGQGPPPGGVRAAKTLACHIALACSNDPELVGQCELPQRVTSIVRQGISMAVLDPLSLFDEGKTGISSVDLWVASVRYGAARRSAAVFVPGRGPAVTRTGV